MGIQDSAIEAMMKNSEALAPLQSEQMQFGLDSARTAYNQSQEDRSWMLNRRGSLSGLQDTLVSEAKNFNTEDRRNELAGEATADVNAAFSSAREQQTRGMARMGVNPSSGRSLAIGNQTSIAQAAAQAGAANKARSAARTEGYALTDRASNALAGYPAMGMTATGAGAGYGASGLTTANAGLAGMNSGYGAAGGMAGQMGSNASNMFGAQASYKNAQDQMANQGDPMMQMIGQGAMMYAMKSDVNAKTKIGGLRKGEALAKVKAIPVTEWQYKEGDSADDGGQRHVGPMAQDVQRVAGDQAAPGGVEIDLISLNGLNMAATQDLDDKVEQLTKVVGRLAIQGGIKQGATHV